MDMVGCGKIAWLALIVVIIISTHTCEHQLILVVVAWSVGCQFVFFYVIRYFIFTRTLVDRLIRIGYRAMCLLTK